jgi:hypothetical protein
MRVYIFVALVLCVFSLFSFAISPLEGFISYLKLNVKVYLGGGEGLNLFVGGVPINEARFGGSILMVGGQTICPQLGTPFGTL